MVKAPVKRFFILSGLTKKISQGYGFGWALGSRISKGKRILKNSKVNLIKAYKYGSNYVLITMIGGPSENLQRKPQIRSRAL